MLTRLHILYRSRVFPGSLGPPAAIASTRIWGGTTQRQRSCLLGRRTGFGPAESSIFDRRAGDENPLAAK